MNDNHTDTCRKRLYEAIGDYTGRQPEDLSFKKGEILTVIKERHSGWFLAETSDGLQGEAPSTFLKIYNTYESDTEDNPVDETNKYTTITRDHTSDTDTDIEEEPDGENCDGKPRLYEAIGDYTGRQPEDLSFKKGEILTVIKERESGWFLAETSEGRRGEAPSTFLQVYNTFTDNIKVPTRLTESDSDDDETGDPDGVEEQQEPRMYQAVSDYASRQPQDLSFRRGEILTILKERESGWFLAENANGIRGDVPKNYLKVYTQYEEGTTLVEKRIRVIKLEEPSTSGTDSEADDSVEGNRPRVYEAISDYTGRESHDLSFRKGEILTVLHERDSGWLQARNAVGDVGDVPINYLKVHRSCEQ